MCLTCGVLAQYVRPMRRCLYRTYPQYLAAHCTPVSAIASRHHLRSAAASLSVCCAVLPLEFIRTSGFLCRRPDDLELTAETST